MSATPKTSQLNTQDLVQMSFFVALICVCSFISLPFTIPLTLQTFAVFVTILFLGTKKSTLTILVYILLGAIGLPVFSNFAGGLGYLFGATGGYIIGFIFTALITGFLTEKKQKNTWQLLLSMTFGLFACYCFGTAWFLFVYTSNDTPLNIFSALTICVFPYIVPDFVKMMLAILFVKKTKRLGAFHK